MANHILDEFGRRLITQVRDEALSDWEMILDGRMKGEVAERVRNTLLNKDVNVFQAVIPEIVDTTLFHLLRWLEQEEEFAIAARLESGTSNNLAEESDGFAGELFSERGWIKKFSQKKG